MEAAGIVPAELLVQFKTALREAGIGEGASKLKWESCVQHEYVAWRDEWRKVVRTHELELSFPRSSTRRPNEGEGTAAQEVLPQRQCCRAAGDAR